MISSWLFLGGIGFQELLIFFIPLVFWIIAIVMLVTAKQDSTTKILWFLIIFFIPLLGALLYLIIGRNQNRLS